MAEKKLDLTTLSNKHAYVKRLKTDLQKGTGQKVVIIEVLKIKRVAGVSAVPIDLTFDAGQKISLYVRDKGDVIKAELNGKQIVLRGDLNYLFDDYYQLSVEDLAKQLKDNQAKFDKKQQSEKIVAPSQKGAKANASKSVANQLKQLSEQEQQLDMQISEQEEHKKLLIQKLELANLQQPVNPS